MPPPIAFVLDGRTVEVPDDGASLLEALRDRLGVRSPKDGCSPQGQCGCCTVLVDDQPRVACVTPVRRVAGRGVTTVDGLADAKRWAAAFAATGASQCGFCTPGIIVRLAAAAARGPLEPSRVDQALLAHLCRCTGWQTIREAAVLATGGGADPTMRGETGGAARRAVLEGGAPQAVGAHIALGRGGFADDTAPGDALVAVPRADGSWALGETLTAARAAAGKVQGRRTTEAVGWPLEVPPGEWARTLRTTWVEPGYLETDASWCRPGGEPATPLANGGAFGGKRHSEVAAAARRLAGETGRPVRALYAREDAVRCGPKRPPIAAGIDAAGRGVLRMVRTAGVAEAVALVAPHLAVEELDVAGPSTSADLRAAGWAEAAILLASVGAPPDTVTAPSGAVASATIGADGTIGVRVRCGDPLDEVVLRSYCIGAAHMALGWVTTEGLAVDADGHPLDLTIRSFGIRRAVDTPRIEVTIEDDTREPVNGSDAVFAAVAAAVWRSLGHPPAWPAQRGPAA
jgi:aerobic-type carbon monoxide dehydrogenase small subunit (CoxS/CutS family)